MEQFIPVTVETVDFNSLAAFKRTVRSADLSAFLLRNCTWCVLFIAVVFLFCTFLSCWHSCVPYCCFSGHMSVPWCTVPAL